MIYKILKKIFKTFILNPINKIRFPHLTKSLAKYKDIHKGERCFIIGNGPSLTAEDLNKLKNEYTFAANRIYNMFEKTTWRPTYYVSQDFVLIEDIMKNIETKLDEINDRFLAINIYHKYTKKIKKNKCNNFFFLKIGKNDKEMPDFSTDLTKCVHEGYTVTYACMQLAVYMGFTEIYLIGVDHNYSVYKDIDGNIIQTDFKDHFSGDEKVDWSKINIPQLDKSTLGYLAAKKYAEGNQIKIYNSTRGGKLEVFERKNFDEIDYK